MQPEEVKKLVEAGMPDCEVTVTGDGSHFEVTVIGVVFDGKSRLARELMVNATIREQITSGALHAVSIKAYSPEEWKTASQLQVS